MIVELDGPHAIGPDILEWLASSFRSRVRTRNCIQQKAVPSPFNFYLDRGEFFLVHNR
jgi:hypothetical protein